MAEIIGRVGECEILRGGDTVKELVAGFPLLIGCALLAVALVEPTLARMAVILALPWFAAAAIILTKKEI